MTTIPTPTPAPFDETVARLSKLSVERHFDAYGDVDWDAPEMQVVAGDPRWAPLAGDPIRGTDWYAGLTDEQRSHYGLYRVAASMKVGWNFENLLQRGLLARAFRVPNGAPEFRYVHHEIIEESQHTLMFQEVVDRSGLDVRGMPRWARIAGTWAVAGTARFNPAMFFFLVLGGEDPIDHVQRRTLREGHPHPLVERIMRIHVTEEARHISFARTYLRREVPRLGRLRRALLAVEVPLVIGTLARMMLAPPADLRRAVGLPGPVARTAMSTGDGAALLSASTRKIRDLCTELGLMTRAGRAAWRFVGLWS